MRQVWEPEDLLAAWTLVEADWELAGHKSGATRLGDARGATLDAVVELDASEQRQRALEVLLARMQRHLLQHGARRAHAAAL